MLKETKELSVNLEKSRSQVGALRSKLAEAQAIGMRDSLTSLGNRRSFDSNLAKEISEARARGTDMCLMMGDLDHFKKVNDNYGHPFGDRVLKYFAELLSKHIKDGDIAARLGGEEFAVILPQTTLESATRLTDQIRNRLEAQQWMNAQSGQLFSKITASFGIVRLGENDDSETLVKRADTMLYEAKRAGRNRIIIERGLPRVEVLWTNGSSSSAGAAGQRSRLARRLAAAIPAQSRSGSAAPNDRPFSRSN